MIDVVFLLLVFFVLSAKFVRDERQLETPLPNQGTDIGLPAADVTEVIIELTQRGTETTARGFATGFAGDTGDRVTRFPSRDDPHLDSTAPDFGRIETYLARAGSRFGRDVPVTIRFDDGVPLQMIVSIMDACKRQRLSNLGLGA